MKMGVPPQRRGESRDAQNAPATQTVSRPTVRRWTRLPRRGLVVFGLLLGGTLVGLLLWDALVSRNALLEQARTDAVDRAELIAEHTARSLDTVDIVLQTFAATVPDSTISGAPGEARDRLEHLLVELPQVRSFRVVDAHGRVVVSVGPTDGLPDRLRHQDYLTAHRDDSRQRLSIGLPYVNGDGWTIPVSRRISLADGSFGGVVVANLEGRYFAALYAQSSPQETTSLALWRSDGVLLARHPVASAELGQRLLPETELVSLSQDFTMIEGVSPIDGRARIASLGPVPGLDKAVTVAVDRDALLAQWRRGTFRRGAAVVLVLALMATGLWVLRRQMADAQAATAQREAAVESSLHAYFFLRSLRDDSGEIVDFVFEDMNRRGEEILTHPRSHWIGQRLCEAIPVNRTDGFFERYKRVVETGEPFELEFEIDSPDVKAKWMRIQAVPLGDGLVIAANDVTQDKAEELARRAAERKLSDIAATVPGMVYQFVMRPDGEMSLNFVSQGVRDLYGLEPEAAEGDAQTLISFMVPEDVPPLIAGVRRSFEKNTPWDADYRILKAGQVRWLRGKSRPERQPDGSTVWNGVVIDVTAEKTATEAMAQARLDAEEANRAKSAFLANMSHELRTPLNAIIGFSQALQHGLGGPVTERQGEYLDHVQAAGRHLLGIIDDVLDLSKIEAGQEELTESFFGLDEVVAGALALVEARAAQKRIAIECADLAGLPVVRGDARRIKQVLLNLLSNAVKFTPAAGQVRLCAAVEPDGALRIAVHDSGPGMTEDEREVALRPFGQAGDPFVRTEGGTGLGLPLSARLLEMHGGRLEIDCRPGEGAHVSALLPADRLLHGGTDPSVLCAATDPEQTAGGRVPARLASA